jgi:hypothetical protein
MKRLSVLLERARMPPKSWENINRSRISNVFNSCDAVEVHPKRFKEHSARIAVLHAISSLISMPELLRNPLHKVMMLWQNLHTER